MQINNLLLLQIRGLSDQNLVSADQRFYSEVLYAIKDTTIPFYSWGVISSEV